MLPGAGISLLPCQQCSHRRGLHKGGRDCRQPECRCGAFVFPIAEEEPETDPVRGMWIAVPPGYVVTVTLTPVDQGGSSD